MPLGCFNRAEYKPTLKVQDGYQPDAWYTDARVAKMVTVPFVMAPDCQYTLTEAGKKDVNCVGCIHKIDVK
jgi:hypothetical protein